MLIRTDFFLLLIGLVVAPSGCIFKTDLKGIHKQSQSSSYPSTCSGDELNHIIPSGLENGEQQCFFNSACQIIAALYPEKLSTSQVPMAFKALINRINQGGERVPQKLIRDAVDAVNVDGANEMKSNKSLYLKIPLGENGGQSDKVFNTLSKLYHFPDAIKNLSKENMTTSECPVFYADNRLFACHSSDVPDILPIVFLNSSPKKQIPLTLTIDKQSFTRPELCPEDLTADLVGCVESKFGGISHAVAWFKKHGQWYYADDDFLITKEKGKAEEYIQNMHIQTTNLPLNKRAASFTIYFYKKRNQSHASTPTESTITAPRLASLAHNLDEVEAEAEAEAEFAKTKAEFAKTKAELQARHDALAEHRRMNLHKSDISLLYAILQVISRLYSDSIKQLSEIVEYKGKGTRYSTQILKKIVDKVNRKVEIEEQDIKQLQTDCQFDFFDNKSGDLVERLIVKFDEVYSFLPKFFDSIENKTVPIIAPYFFKEITTGFKGWTVIDDPSKKNDHIIPICMDLDFFRESSAAIPNPFIFFTLDVQFAEQRKSKLNLIACILRSEHTSISYIKQGNQWYGYKHGERISVISESGLKELKNEDFIHAIYFYQEMK